MIGRAVLVVALLTSCVASDDGPPIDPPPPDPLDVVWAETIRLGDLIVAVPGTGGYDGLGKRIEDAIDPEHPEALPVLEGRTIVNAADTLEGAIAAATRAGLSDADLEAGNVTLAMWGTGITRTTAFEYRSLRGLRVTFEVVGGQSVCAIGGIPQNLLRYTQASADLDASDLYRRVQAWQQSRPAVDRRVIVVAHSWGGVVAEYLATNLATMQTRLGALAHGSFAFMISAGVPRLVPGITPLGPGLRTVHSRDGGILTSVPSYEIDRADDPAHTFDFRGNPGGHHYIIMFGEDFQGVYRISTDELSCDRTPGPCPDR